LKWTPEIGQPPKQGVESWKRGTTMTQRRKFTPTFKAQVVLEVLTSVKRPAQACREYGLKDSVLARWRQQFLQRAPSLFEPTSAPESCQARIAELERLVGRLTLELEIAKKAFGLWASPQNRNGNW